MPPGRDPCHVHQISWVKANPYIRAEGEKDVKRSLLFLQQISHVARKSHLQKASDYEHRCELAGEMYKLVCPPPTPNFDFSFAFVLW